MRTVRKSMLIALLCCGLVAAGTTAAGAAPPDIQRMPFTQTFIDNTCPFPLHETFDGHLMVHLFSDGGETYVRRVSHVQIQGTITNPVSGATATVRQSNLFSRDLGAGTRDVIGLRLLITAPGAGSLLVDAGRVLNAPDGSITFQAGLHQLVDGDLDRFCDAMR